MSPLRHSRARLVGNVIQTTVGDVNPFYTGSRYADISVRAVAANSQFSPPPGLRMSVTGVTVMANIADVRRVVHSHQWQDLAEWVRFLDELADLTDEEIEGVTGKSAPYAMPSAA